MVSETDSKELTASRVVLVTGAAGGIGSAIVHRFLQDGDRVVLCDADNDKISGLSNTLNELHPERVMACSVNVTDEAAVASMVADIESRWGSVDVLVNNAGIQGRAAPLWEQSVEEWREVIDVNLNSVFILSRAVIPSMIKKKAGTIISMSSQRGKDGAPGLTHYAASKGAIIVLTRSLAKECAPFGIGVHAVAPGPIDAGMGAGAAEHPEIIAKLNVPMGRFGKAEEVAELVHIVASDRISFSTGYCWDVSGGKAVS